MASTPFKHPKTEEGKSRPWISGTLEELEGAWIFRTEAEIIPLAPNKEFTNILLCSQMTIMFYHSDSVIHGLGFFIC